MIAMERMTALRVSNLESRRIRTLAPILLRLLPPIGKLHQPQPGLYRALDMEVSSTRIVLVIFYIANLSTAASPIPVYTPAPLWRPGGIDYNLHYWGSF